MTFLKILFKSIFFNILLVLEAQPTEYQPMQVTRSDSYPFAVLIINYPLYNPAQMSFGSGIVINIRWVLTKGKVIGGKKAENLAVVGAGVSTFSSTLDDTTINPVDKIVVKEGYNSKGESLDDVGLVKTQKLLEVSAIMPYWLPVNQEQDVLTNVYWVLQDQNFNKFELSWITHGINEQICLDNDSAKFCSTQTTELDKLNVLNTGKKFPCTKIVKSIGGPIIGHNRLQGIYMGYSDPERGNGCDEKRGRKRAHWGVRYLHVIDGDNRIEKHLDDWIGSHVNEDYSEPVPHTYKYATDRISTTQKGSSKATNSPVLIEELGKPINYSDQREKAKPCKLQG